MNQVISNLFDVEKIRKDFPILDQTVYNKPLVYLDNAATSQKPRQVIEALDDYYRTYNSNVHRGIHYLSEKATDAYESSRTKVKEFLNAPDEKEIIFVRGTTEAVNLVASSYGELLQKGDEIILTEMEHHSNIVPWQLLSDRKGIVLKYIPINDSGELELDKLSELISGKTKLISVVHISNSLGTINPIKNIIDLAHQQDIPVMIDGAQAAPHKKIDVQELDCDFYAISGHKMFGPTGIGALYAKEKWLEKMPPYHGGGEMIDEVTLKGSTFKEAPYKFEAGTPNIAGAIGLGAAIDYINMTEIKNIEIYEYEIFNYIKKALTSIDELKMIGTAKNKASVISFVINNIHPLDLGTMLNTEGIAIRTGHHCCQPVMEKFKLPATCRASLSFYNTKNEIDLFISAIMKAKKIF